MRPCVPILLSLLLSLLATTATCAEPSSSADNRFEATSNLGYTYRLNFAEDHADVMKPLHATVQILTADGALVSGATLDCALTMPAMAMPTNAPSLKESTPGSYQGIFLLTMGGLWHMETNVAYADGRTDRAVVAFAGVDPGSYDNAVSKKLESLFQEQSTGSAGN